MTEISFHFNAPDKLAYACRLLRKAVNSGTRVLVAGEPDALRQLDAALWTFSALDFVPHCFQDGDAAQIAASPVILARQGSSGPQAASAPNPPDTPGVQPPQVAQVLLNLGGAMPDGFEQFERLIEVVGVDDEDREGARQRWKQYAKRGYTITRHDVAPSATL